MILWPHTCFFPCWFLLHSWLPLPLPDFLLFKYLNSLCAWHHAGYKERLTHRLRKGDRDIRLDTESQLASSELKGQAWWEMARIWLSLRPAQDPLTLAVGAPGLVQLPSNSDIHKPVCKVMNILSRLLPAPGSHQPATNSLIFPSSTCERCQNEEPQLR